MGKAPLGFFDANASGLIRGRLDAAAADTETLLAHNLADIVGTITLFLAMLALMFLFDWRMGCACLLAAVISILSMFAMMGGKNAGFVAQYQAALDRMSKAGTEYVRGIPVVKIFQQTVYSFKAFQASIEEYSYFAEHYNSHVCSKPQSVNLTFTEGAFVFLVPAALFLAPAALADGAFPGFVANFAFSAVFSAIISPALARILFPSSGTLMAHPALGPPPPARAPPGRGGVPAPACARPWSGAGGGAPPGDDAGPPPPQGQGQLPPGPVADLLDGRAGHAHLAGAFGLGTAQQIDEAERLVLLHRHFHRAASAPFQGGEAGVPGERADAPAFSGPRHVHPSVFGLCQYYSMFLAYVK